MKKLYAMSLTILVIGLFILSNGVTFAEENVTEQVNDTADQTSTTDVTGGSNTTETVSEPTDNTIDETVDVTETTTAEVTETTTSEVTETTTVPTPGQTPKSPGFGSFITIVALVSMAYILLRR